MFLNHHKGQGPIEYLVFLTINQLNPPILNTSLQHNYTTRCASLQNLNPESFTINIRIFSNYFRILLLGMIFLYLYATSQLENHLKKQFTSFIFHSIDNSNITYLFTMHLLFPLQFTFYPKITVRNQMAYTYFTVFCLSTQNFFQPIYFVNYFVFLFVKWKWK